MSQPNPAISPNMELFPEAPGAEDDIEEGPATYGMPTGYGATYFEAVGTSDRLGDYEGEDDGSYSQG